MRESLHLKYGDPGQSDVVERDGATVRIAESGLTQRVVLVPVDTRGFGRDRRVASVDGH